MIVRPLLQPNVEIMMMTAISGTPKFGDTRSSTAVPTRSSFA